MTNNEELKIRIEENLNSSIKQLNEAKHYFYQINEDTKDEVEKKLEDLKAKIEQQKIKAQNLKIQIDKKIDDLESKDEETIEAIVNEEDKMTWAFLKATRTEEIANDAVKYVMYAIDDAEIAIINAAFASMEAEKFVAHQQTT
jgi:acetyl-CoA carboxylase alpha subunit